MSNEENDSKQLSVALSDKDKAEELRKEAVTSNISLDAITTNKPNERGIPEVLFIEDIGKFAESFTPAASAEILIGAFSDLFSKFKAYETNLSSKKQTYEQKIPEIEKSLSLVKYLKKKSLDDENSTIVTRYNLHDTIYAKAQIDCNVGLVNLWLGANVMLEYTYDEAIDLLSSKMETAKQELNEIINDLGFTRNQIITAEVNISRIYNWDVRVKRSNKSLQAT